MIDGAGLFMIDGAGFVPTTDTDHRAWLWVTGFLALIYSLLCLAARVTGKWGLLWWDDLVLGGSYVTAFLHWGLLFASLSHGLGVSELALSDSTLKTAGRLYFAARVPFFVSHCLSKLSILIFTRRIFAGDIHKENIIFGVAYAITILYGVAGVLLSSAGCRPEEALIARVNAVCDANEARWAIITVLDGLSEIFVLAMPVWFISKNQLKASKKRIVVLVYIFRLIVLGFSVAVTVTYFQFLRGGRNSIGIVNAVVWEEVLLAFSIISASFPCLRTFLWAFMSRGLMTMYGNTTTVSGSEQRSHHTSVQLQSLNNKSGSRLDSEPGIDGTTRPARLRPEWFEYRVNVSGEGTKPKKKNSATGGLASLSMRRSDDSDRMIIHQETSYRVESI
ncbi:hypothetical protein TI39_contig372g00002 [Zymoseptoria brevis]|uniref:Rhodopsin domain-containing protein n=1 Tax=Zymoseptoria brevis TaxID=1047168 RepID=A0A0F4GQ10_9PEZI|nr:hypothetical protein TI39_contig372g00002 [Zymoseptoria brevis]